jgi:DNA polymerase III alpha subunit (gram-positive type)
MTIRIIDLETTGIDTTAHVVEVGSVDLLPNGIIARAQEHLVKPPCLIPAEAQAVHHITDEDVAHAKPWKVVADAFFNRSACSDLVAFAAHNAAFEKKWLTPALLGRHSGDLYLQGRRSALAPSAETFQSGITLLATAGPGPLDCRSHSPRDA